MNHVNILAYLESENVSLSDGQKAVIAEFQNQAEAWKNEAAALAEEQAQMQLAQLAEEEMRRYGVSNPRVVWALLNQEKITLEEGEVKGLAEQLEELKRGEDTAFLFESKRPKPKFVPVGKVGRHRENAARAVMGLGNK